MNRVLRSVRIILLLLMVIDLGASVYSADDRNQFRPQKPKFALYSQTYDPTHRYGNEFFVAHYEEKFGAYPDLFLWSDINSPIRSSVYMRREFYDTVNPRNDELLIKDISDHLFWEYSALNDSILHFSPVTQINDSLQIQKMMSANIHLVAEDFPNMRNNILYNIQMKYFDGQPYTSESIWSSRLKRTAVKTERSCSIDSIYWGYYTQQWTAEYVETLLKKHPHSQKLLGKKLHFALEGDSSCTVIKGIATTMANSFQFRLDPMQRPIDYRYTVDVEDENFIFETQHSPEYVDIFDFLMEIISNCEEYKEWYTSPRYPIGYD